MKKMTIKFNAINDFNVENKTVLVRVDINSPVDPNSGVILDDTRMKLHSQTIKELSNKGAKTVILAHQSRPGKTDFTTLKQHAEVLAMNLGLKVTYIDSIFSSQAIDLIKDMRKGEIILLENVRFFSEESISNSPLKQSKTLLVRKLAPLFDFYVNDAFAAAHRSQPSLVGFTEVIPSAAGLIMELELKTINAALENVAKPCVFVLGGMKADDSIDVMKNVLENETADFILTTGLVANIILLAADVNIGEPNKKFIEEKGYLHMVEKSRKLLKKYKDNIIYPEDVAIEEDDKRRDVTIDKIPNNPIFDIGIETIKNYAKIIRNAKTIFANGPAGVFENPKFAMGTEDLLNAIATSEGFSIIGGGHIAAAAVSMGFDEKMDHIISGGGACISLLAGNKLDAVDALENSAEKFKNNIK
jgi:phosphoglycerate kinase